MAKKLKEIRLKKREKGCRGAGDRQKKKRGETGKSKKIRLCKGAKIG